MTFWTLIKPHRSKISLALFYILVVNILSLALPWGIKMIIDDALQRKDIRLLNGVVFGLVGLVILQTVFNFLRKMMSNIIGENIVCDLREKIYWHIQRISLASIKRMTPPQMMTRMTSDVESVRRFIFGDAMECVFSTLSVGFILMVLLWVNLRLTLVASMTLPLFMLVYFRMIPQLQSRYRRLRDVNGRLAARVHEVLHGMTIVRTFTAERHEKEYFSLKQREIFHLAKDNHALNVGLWTGIDFFTSLGVMSVLWIGGRDVIQQRMTPGELIAFYSYLGMLFSPLIRLVVINGSFQEADAALKRINELMDMKEEVPQIPSAVILPQLKGLIEFRNVDFRYAANGNVVEDIHISVKQGETVGIVGASGAGKTTLMNLLIRFYDPQKGGIYIDGHNLRKLDLNTYRQNLAVVLQDDYLFSGTIQDNICYPRSLSGPRTAAWRHDESMKELRCEMERMAALAQADDFIHSFKDGYMTQVGDRGRHLSSGQRQRIAIARALMRRPAILILDEATSALDAITENDIQDAIRRHMKGKTVFIVAHRFSTIMGADKIIVLDHGRIVEMGAHDALLKKHGFYSRLYWEQFKDEDIPSLTNVVNVS